jgi:hypothetical protein
MGKQGMVVAEYELLSQGIRPEGWDGHGRRRFDVRGHDNYQDLSREADQLRRELDLVRGDLVGANRILEMLLELEPTLDRYRRRGQRSRPEWDGEGMNRALRFRADQELAEKYTSSRAVD